MMERNKFVVVRLLPCMHILVYYDYTTVQQEHRFYFLSLCSSTPLSVDLPFMET